jgi:hypothetical protein
MFHIRSKDWEKYSKHFKLEENLTVGFDNWSEVPFPLFLFQSHEIIINFHCGLKHSVLLETVKQEREIKVRHTFASQYILRFEEYPFQLQIEKLKENQQEYNFARVILKHEKEMNGKGKEQINKLRESLENMKKKLENKEVTDDLKCYRCKHFVVLAAVECYPDQIICIACCLKYKFNVEEFNKVSKVKLISMKYEEIKNSKTGPLTNLQTIINELK